MSFPPIAIAGLLKRGAFAMFDAPAQAINKTCRLTFHRHLPLKYFSIINAVQCSQRCGPGQGKDSLGIYAECFHGVGGAMGH